MVPSSPMASTEHDTVISQTFQNVLYKLEISIKNQCPETNKPQFLIFTHVIIFSDNLDTGHDQPDTGQWPANKIKMWFRHDMT